MDALELPGCAPWPMCQGYGHGERIFDVAFHPLNDDIVLTASEDTSVRMWRRAEGSPMYKQARAYLGHTGEVLRVAWAANGLLLASGSADRTVRLWAADLYDQGYTGRQLAVLDGHPEEVYHVELMDPAAPPPPPPAGYGAGGGGGPGGGGLRPFESHVLSASCESLFVWSLEEGALVQQADAPGTSGSAITQDDIARGARPAYIFAVSRQPAGGPGGGGRLLAAACCDGCVRLWAVRPTGHLEWAGQVELPGGLMCTGCAFAADGCVVGVVTRQGQLVELDVRTRALLSTRTLPASPLTIAHMPRGRRPAGGGGDASSGGGGASGGGCSACELWLVACRDGAVHGYEVGGTGSEPACSVRPPAAPGVAVLAVAVAAGGGAVAVAGEPQDASLLPPMRQQQQPGAAAGRAAAAATTSHVANGSDGGGGVTGRATGGANGASRAEAAAAAVGPSAAAAGAKPAAAALAAPSRRRRGAGAAPRDPLAVLDAQAGECEERQQAPSQSARRQSEADPPAGGLAAMSLGDAPRPGDGGSGGSGQRPQPRPGSGPGEREAQEAARSGREEEHAPERGAQGASGGGGAGSRAGGGMETTRGSSPPGAPAAGNGSGGSAGAAAAAAAAGPEEEGGQPARMRAALFVYRADLA